LAAEVRRLAGLLGAEAGLLSWRASGGGDDGPGLEQVAQALAAAAARARPAAVLLAETALARHLAPLLAHHLGCGSVLGCSDVRVAGGGLVLVKPVYGGWLEQELRATPSRPVVATLDLAGLEVPDDAESAKAAAAAATAAAAGAAGEEAPVIEGVEVIEVSAAGPSRVRRLRSVPPDPRSVDLIHAKRIVAAGAGGAGEGLLTAVVELADLLEGSLGATRPVVDEGRLPKERLIGQTGKTVTPELYLALGVSGSPHHMAGVQKAGRVLSINRDGRAPILGLSDVGYVADLAEVLPLLLDKIKTWRDRAEDADERV
jgi:electron transfer flavoprotein alpha subunit